MKRTLLALVALLALALPTQAQTPTIRAFLTTTVCPGAGCTVLSVAGMGSASVQVTGTFSGTLQLESSLDGVTYTSLSMTPSAGGSAVTSATAPGVWSSFVGGMGQVRVRFSSYTSGTATVTIAGAPGLAAPGLTGIIIGNGVNSATAFPIAGSDGQCLQTDGMGTLSWGSCGGGGGAPSGWTWTTPALSAPAAGEFRQLIATPTNLAAGSSGTGGDWPDGTYYIAVVGTDLIGGATVPSNEITVVVSGGTTVPLTWDWNGTYQFIVLVGTAPGVYTKQTAQIDPFVVLGSGAGAWSALTTAAPPTPNTAYRSSSSQWTVATADGTAFSILAPSGYFSIGTGAPGNMQLYAQNADHADVAIGDTLGQISFGGMSGMLTEGGYFYQSVAAVPTPYSNILHTFTQLVVSEGDATTEAGFGFFNAVDFGASGSTAPTFELSDVSGNLIELMQTGATTLSLFGSRDQMTTADLIVSGAMKAGSYKSSDGTDGATVTTCTGFKNGLCVSGT